MATIRDVIAKKGSEVATISTGATALEAADMMNAHRIGALCVVEGETLVGMFTERDLLNRVVSARLDAGSAKITDVMTSQLITCGLDGTTEDCVAVMSHEHVRHLPVVEDGKLVGLISTGDLMALKVDEKQAFIDDLYLYLHGRT